MYAPRLLLIRYRLRLHLRLLLPSRRHLRQTSTWTSRLRWAAPDLNSELQIAVGSAGPQQRAPDCSGQRRTSPGELPSGLGSAGPHPGSSRADWAVPGLSGQKIFQKICQKRMSETMQKKCQKICHEICQKRMSERMSEDMSEEMSEDMSIEMSERNVKKNVR